MYLNKQLLKPGTAVVNSVNEAKGSAEYGNVQIAVNLAAGKTRLINILSQFPATALYLLHRYEVDTKLKQAGTAELMVALTEIKSHYLRLPGMAEVSQSVGNRCDRLPGMADSSATLTTRVSQSVRLPGMQEVEQRRSSCRGNRCDWPSLSFSGRGFKREVDALEKQRLTEALQAFPFSFEDLVLLTELIIVAFKTRDVYHQSVQNYSDWVVKRLDGSNRCDKLKLPDIIDAMRASQFDEQFLFLPDVDMQCYVTDMVFAEHLWLRSRQALAEANSGLVLYIANQYRCGFLDFDDLVQEGQIGLLRAVDKFDCRLGFQFSTYAAYWIKQAMSRALSRCERVVRVPCEQVANIHKVLRAKNALLAKTGREPAIKALADYSKIPDEQINAILAIAQTAVSLENRGDDDESLAPIDFLEQQVFAQPFKKIEQSDLKAWLAKAIKILDPRELKVICCHFGISNGCEMTLQEIGAELSLTRERVRQIQVKALNKMKLSYGKQLMSFL